MKPEDRCAEVTTTLRHLVRRGREMLLAFEGAIDRLRDPVLREEMYCFKGEREANLRGLQACLAEVDGAPVDESLSVPRLTGVTSDEGLLRAVQVDDVTVVAYARLLEHEGLAPGLRRVLRRCLVGERAYHAWIEERVRAAGC